MQHYMKYINFLYNIKIIYILTLTASNITLNTFIYIHYDIIKNIV